MTTTIRNEAENPKNPPTKTFPLLLFSMVKTHPEVVSLSRSLVSPKILPIFFRLL
jgi:hypothetical protein